MRFASVAIRRYKLHAASVKLLKLFNIWRKVLNELPSYKCKEKKLLIIRLDDIGDYILFRNFLMYYKESKRWENYTITLLANSAWKDLFELYDAASVDKVIWVDKKKYFNNESYRKTLWIDLRNEGFETVICSSRTRQLLLDDICAIATGAKYKIAAANLTYHDSWNIISDDVYTDLFHISDVLAHEFNFNKAFTEWCCLMNVSNVQFNFLESAKRNKTHIICFISASTNSKKWPLQNWIDFIKLLQQHYQYKISIAGGNSDAHSANIIQSATKVDSITGKTTLTEITNLIAEALIIISSDTMAAHIAAACNTPLILLANGNNFYRFTNYSAVKQNVQTLYPQAFIKKLKQKSKAALKEYIAVTKDIGTIKPLAVLNAVSNILKDDDNLHKHR